MLNLNPRGRGFPPVFPSICQATFLALGVLLMPTHRAEALIPVGRGEILLHTRGGITYDSNVFALEDAEDDFLLTLNPELQYIRRAGRGDLSARAGVTVGRFFDFSEEDHEDYYVILSAGYPVPQASPFSGGAEFSYRQDSTLSETLNQRTQSERYTVTVNNSYRMNQRLGLRNSLIYRHSDNRGFSRVDRFTASLGTAYFYSENLDFSATYRISRARTTGRTDRGTQGTLGHAISLGANGDLTEKVSGNASVGVQHTQTISGVGRDRTRTIFAVGLGWAARANTTLSLDGSRDFDLSADDRQVERTSVQLGLNQRLTPKMSGRAFAGYRLADFRGVESNSDETYITGCGLSYSLTTHWDASLDYGYNRTDSDRREVTFDRHTVALSTSYTF